MTPAEARVSGTVLPVDRIDPDRMNIRRDYGDLSELEASIRSLGILQPLVVRHSARGGRWVIVDGHRRFKAAQRAGLTTVPAVASKQGGSRSVEMMLAAAMHKALDPVEQAAAFERLRDAGMKVSEIASSTGYSVATVTDRLALAGAPEQVKEMVRDKQLSPREGARVGREVSAGGSSSARLRGPGRPPYFNASHPLAPVVRACEHADRPRVGGQGCGQCWEAAIRADEAAAR